MIAVLAQRLGRSLTIRTRFGAERLARTADRLYGAIAGQIEARVVRLATLSAKLDALSPLKVLHRGFAVARDDEGEVLKYVTRFKSGMDFRLTVTDGDVRARVAGEES